MRFHFLVSAALLAAALPLQAQAQSGRACMIESPIQTLGAPTLITDCLQGRKGTSRSAIKDRCEGVAWNNHAPWAWPHCAGAMLRADVRWPRHAGQQCMPKRLILP